MVRPSHDASASFLQVSIQVKSRILLHAANTWGLNIHNVISRLDKTAMKTTRLVIRGGDSVHHRAIIYVTAL